MDKIAHLLIFISRKYIINTKLIKMTFENIFKENYLYIYNFALKLSCHPQDAEDLTQQTFFTAFKKFNQLKEEKALKKWLATICYNQFLMFIRKNGAGIREETSTEIDELEKLGTELPACLPQPEEEVIVADQIKSLQNGCFMAMVRKLSLKQRIAFSLVDMCITTRNFWRVVNQ